MDHQLSFILMVINAAWVPYLLGLSFHQLDPKEQNAGVIPRDVDGYPMIGLAVDRKIEAVVEQNEKERILFTASSSSGRL